MAYTGPNLLLGGTLDVGRTRVQSSGSARTSIDLYFRPIVKLGPGYPKGCVVLLALALHACGSSPDQEPIALPERDASAQSKVERGSAMVGGLEVSGEALHVEGLWLGSHEGMWLGGYVPLGHASEGWRHRLFVGGLRKTQAGIGADLAYDQTLYALDFHTDQAVQVEVEVPSYPEFPTMLITTDDGLDHMGLVDIVWQHGPSLLRSSSGSSWTANASSFLDQEVESGSPDQTPAFYALVDALVLDGGDLLAIGAPAAPWSRWASSRLLRPTGEVLEIAGSHGRLPISFRVDGELGLATLPSPDLYYSAGAGDGVWGRGIRGSGARARFSVPRETGGRLKRVQPSKELESLIESADKDFPIVSVHSGGFTGSQVVDVLASSSPSGWKVTGLLFSRAGAPRLFAGPTIHVEGAAEAVAGYGLTDLNGDGVRDAAVLLVADAQPAESIVVFLCGSTGDSLGLVRLSTRAPMLSFGHLTFGNGDGVALIGAPQEDVGGYREAGLVLALSFRGSDGAALSKAEPR